jgi:transcriptional regulator of acetoin/glycerol metabolism
MRIDVVGSLARVRKEARASLARLQRAGLKRIRAIDREIERLSGQQDALVASLGVMLAEIRQVAELDGIARRARGKKKGTAASAPRVPSGRAAGGHLHLVGGPRWRVAPETMTLREMERDHIAAVLANCDWNQSLSAIRLGIGRNTLMRKVKAFGLKKTPKAA